MNWSSKFFLTVLAEVKEGVCFLNDAKNNLQTFIGLKIFALLDRHYFFETIMGKYHTYH